MFKILNGNLFHYEFEFLICQDDDFIERWIYNETNWKPVLFVGKGNALYSSPF